MQRLQRPSFFQNQFSEQSLQAIQGNLKVNMLRVYLLGVLSDKLIVSVR